MSDQIRPGDIPSLRNLLEDADGNPIPIPEFKPVVLTPEEEEEVRREEMRAEKRRERRKAKRLAALKSKEVNTTDT